MKKLYILYIKIFFTTYYYANQIIYKKKNKNNIENLK